MGKKITVGVLASGTGTNLQTIIDASEKGIIDVEVVTVISDTKDAFALKRANKHKIGKWVYCHQHANLKEDVLFIDIML